MNESDLPVGLPGNATDGLDFSNATHDFWPLARPNFEVRLYGVLSHGDPLVFFPSPLLELALEVEGQGQQLLLLGSRVQEEHWTAITVTEWRNWPADEADAALPPEVVGAALLEVMEGDREAKLKQVQRWAAAVDSPLIFLHGIQEAEATAIIAELSVNDGASVREIDGFFVYWPIVQADSPRTETVLDEAGTILSDAEEAISADRL